MPDWLELVRQRLSGLALGSKEKEEVHLELAAHLEESYETFRSEGLADHEAIRRTLAESGRWKDLQRRIDSARSGKDTMTNRVKQLWIPSLATLIVSMILLPVLEWLGLNPHFFFFARPSRSSIRVPRVHGLAVAPAVRGRSWSLPFQPRGGNEAGGLDFRNLSGFRILCCSPSRYSIHGNP
jgi:hypothetical protein